MQTEAECLSLTPKFAWVCDEISFYVRPQGEGEWYPGLQQFEARRIFGRAGGDSPSPGGEGRGEGEPSANTRNEHNNQTNEFSFLQFPSSLAKLSGAQFFMIA